MGRKANFGEDERPKKGPGRKAKKQKDPVFPRHIQVVNQKPIENLTRVQKLKLSRKQKKKTQKKSEIEQENVKKLSKASSELKEQLLNQYSGKNSKWMKKQDDDGSEDENIEVENLDAIDSGEGSDEVDEFEDDNANEEDVDEEDNENVEDEDEDVKLNIASDYVFTFPSDENETLPIPEIEQRIRDVLLVLSDFKKFREKDRNRKEYLSLLKKDLCTYFSYNEFLMERIMDLFPLDELMNFLEASETQRPVTIRTNTLKTRRRDLAQALIARGVNVDPVGKWSNEGLVVYSSPVPIGATPEYLTGFYMLQAASSLLPVIALQPHQNERILDMCAAPGGKASHIAALMKNTGVLYANDVNKSRVNGIVGNFHRLGITNSVISCVDGRKIPQIIKGFDRVLVDAPCTGTGVISKDTSVKTSKTESDVQRCFTLQRELLLAAIDALNSRSSSGSYLVYSTCSILPEENEAVVNYALKKRDVKLVPTGLEFGVEGFVNYRQHRFHPSMNLTRRFYPHTHNMDGFFVAKLKKFSDAIRTPKDEIEIAGEDNLEEDSGLEVESDNANNNVPRGMKRPKHGHGKNRSKIRKT